MKGAVFCILSRRARRHQRLYGKKDSRCFLRHGFSMVDLGAAFALVNFSHRWRRNQCQHEFDQPETQSRVTCLPSYDAAFGADEL